MSQLDWMNDLPSNARMSSNVGNMAWGVEHPGVDSNLSGRLPMCDMCGTYTPGPLDPPDAAHSLYPPLRTQCILNRLVRMEAMLVKLVGGADLAPEARQTPAQDFGGRVGE